MKVYKELECPNCGARQYAFTTNLYEKKKECRECGEVRDLKVVD